MKNKEKIREEQFRDFTIKIDRVRSIKKLLAGEEYKDKMFLVNIKYCGNTGGVAFSVKLGRNYGRSLRKVFRKIQEELYLK